MVPARSPPCCESSADSGVPLSSCAMTAVSHCGLRRKKRKQRMFPVLWWPLAHSRGSVRLNGNFEGPELSPCGSDVSVVWSFLRAPTFTICLLCQGIWQNKNLLTAKGTLGTPALHGAFWGPLWCHLWGWGNQLANKGGEAWMLFANFRLSEQSGWGKRDLFFLV